MQPTQQVPRSILALAALTLAPVASAAVTFAVTNLDVASTATGLEIQNDGDLVRAIYYGGPLQPWYSLPLPTVGDPTVTVHGVTFANGSDVGGNIIDSAYVGGYNGSYTGAIAAPTDYNYSLFIGATALTVASPWGLTIGGLTPDHTYRLQFISNEPQSPATLTGTVEDEAFAFTTGPQMLTATWTATAGDTELNVASSSFTHITGYALHDMGAVPEPSTCLLLGGMSAIALLRRRR